VGDFAITIGVLEKASKLAREGAGTSRKVVNNATDVEKPIVEFLDPGNFGGESLFFRGGSGVIGDGVLLRGVGEAGVLEELLSASRALLR
jgi:hypothetical protein